MNRRGFLAGVMSLPLLRHLPYRGPTLVPMTLVEGSVALVGGTATIHNTAITANTVVVLMRKTNGGVIGMGVTYSVIPATSFTITSDSVLDTSTFNYILHILSN